MPTIYVVTGTAGIFDERVWWTAAAFVDRHRADEFAMAAGVESERAQAGIEAIERERMHAKKLTNDRECDARIDEFDRSVALDPQAPKVSWFGPSKYEVTAMDVR